MFQNCAFPMWLYRENKESIKENKGMDLKKETRQKRQSKLHFVFNSMLGSLTCTFS